MATASRLLYASSCIRERFADLRSAPREKRTALLIMRHGEIAFDPGPLFSRTNV